MTVIYLSLAILAGHLVQIQGPDSSSSTDPDDEVVLSRIEKLWTSYLSKISLDSEAVSDQARQVLEMPTVPLWWKARQVDPSSVLEPQKKDRQKFRLIESDFGALLTFKPTPTKTITYTIHPRAGLHEVKTAHVYKFKNRILVILPGVGIKPLLCLVLDSESGELVAEQTINAIPHIASTGPLPVHRIEAVEIDNAIAVFGNVGIIFYAFSLEMNAGSLHWDFCVNQLVGSKQTEAE